MKISLKPITIVFITLLVVIACKKNPEEVKPVTNPGILENMLSWNFASVPLRFSESNRANNVAYGFNRAKISWYNIDPKVFYDKSSNLIPPNLSLDDMSADDCRIIFEPELFPNKESQYGAPINLNVLNIDYYPSERGPWNYDTHASSFSAGIGNDGKLNEPSTRWSGITRDVSGIEYKINYLDFWLIDPFSTYPDASGELYFDIGEISEDVLKDGFLSAENINEGTSRSTVWGLIKPVSNDASFPATNSAQYDTGLDELKDTDETNYFSEYLKDIKSICNPSVYTSIFKDPANDNYHSFLGTDYTEMNYKVRERYKNYNGGEQNSFPGSDNNTTIYQHSPNSEDINSNGKLDTVNNYYEYKINIKKESFVLNSNFIESIFYSMRQRRPNGSLADTRFYHFRIPITEYSAKYGTPNLSLNPKFIRLYMTGFSTPVNLRFINLTLSEEIIEYTSLQN